MPRSLMLAVPPDTTEQLKELLLEADGVLSLRVTPGTSVKPPGDVLELEVLDQALPAVMTILDDHGLGRDEGTSLTTSTPLSVVSATSTARAVGDTNESTLEEMEQIMSREARPTAAVLSLMAISGILATIGIAQSALHLVVAAMIIAPGFVPVVRAVFGGIARRDITRGVVHTAQSYAALLIGAGAAAGVLTALGHDPAGREPSYEPALVSVTYWTSVTPEAVLVTLAAGVAGGLLIATNRAVLTAGVMVALALVPAAALVPIAVIAADWALAGAAAARWLVDVALLGVSAGAVLLAKQRFVHRARTLP